MIFYHFEGKFPMKCPLWPSGSNGEISGAKQTDSHGGETTESARKADRKAPIRKLDLIQTVKELSSF